MDLVNNFDVPAESDIYRTFAQRVNDFRPQYQDLANLETTAYAAPATEMAKYNADYGSQPGQGPDAMTRLSAVLNNIGRQYGTRDVYANTINAAKGRIEDLAKSTAEGLALKRQSYLDRYGMLTPLFNAKTQAEEAARQRAFEADQAARSRSAAAATAKLQMQSYEDFLKKYANLGKSTTGPSQGDIFYNQVQQGRPVSNGQLVAGPILPGGGFIPKAKK